MLIHTDPSDIKNVFLQIKMFSVSYTDLTFKASLRVTFLKHFSNINNKKQSDIIYNVHSRAMFGTTIVNEADALMFTIVWLAMQGPCGGFLSCRSCT